MNTAVVKTQLGRTILVQLDETSPRPYSRANLIQGTEGTLAGFPTRVAGESWATAIIMNGLKAGKNWPLFTKNTIIPSGNASGSWPRKWAVTAVWTL